MAHLGRLAAVEVQSIMHMLDCTSLLRLARCSRQLHSDAASDVAWRHLPTYAIAMNGRNLDIGARIRHSLLAHIASATLEWSSHSNQYATTTDVDALLDVSRITSLTITLTVSSRQWELIMRHAALDDLRELVISPLNSPLSMPSNFVESLVRLQHFHTLRCETNPNNGLLNELPRLSHLTTLHMADLDHNDLDPTRVISRTPVIQLCAHLTDLQLTMPLLYAASRFREFFTSPHMCRLVRLTLDMFWAGGLESQNWPAVPTEDFIVVFQAMTRLRHLCFRRSRGVDHIFAAVAQAPALEELVLIVSPTRPAALAALRQARPTLDVRLC